MRLTLRENGERTSPGHDPADAGYLATEIRTVWGDARRPRLTKSVTIETEVPSRVRPEHVAAELEFTAYHGRWWVSHPPVTAGEQGARRTIRWQDDVCQGSVVLAPLETDPQTYEVTISARLRTPDLLCGMPLVSLGVDLLSASGSPVAIADLVLADLNQDPDPREVSELLHVEAEAVRLADAPVRLRLGVASIAQWTTGTLERRGTAHTAPETKLVAAPRSATSGSDARIERVRFEERNADSYTWEPGDHRTGLPEVSRTVSASFHFKWEPGDYEMRITREEFADFARICRLSGPWCLAHEDGFEDVRVERVDVIWDGLTNVPGITGEILDPEDADDSPYVREGLAQPASPLLRLHLSRPVDPEKFVSALSAQTAFTARPASLAPDEPPFDATDYNAYTHAVSEAYAARWRAALWLAGGYRGRTALRPDALVGGDDETVRRLPLSKWFERVDTAMPAG